MALGNAVDQMLEFSNPAAGDHGHRHGVRNRADQSKIIAALGAVAIHRRDEKLARAEFGQPHRVRDSVDARRAASTVRQAGTVSADTGSIA